LATEIFHKHQKNGFRLNFPFLISKKIDSKITPDYLLGDIVDRVK